MTMGRRFTESEVLALTRNRQEEKRLKNRLEKLKDERGFYQEVSDKEKERLKQFHRESRRSSGISPFTTEDRDYLHNQPMDNSLMRRFSKPWAICPNETTYNVVFKEISSTTGSSNTARKLSSSSTKGLQSRRKSRKLSDSFNNDYAVGNDDVQTLVAQHPEASYENEDVHKRESEPTQCVVQAEPIIHESLENNVLDNETSNIFTETDSPLNSHRPDSEETDVQLMESVSKEEDKEYLEYLLHKRRLKKKKKALFASQIQSDDVIESQESRDVHVVEERLKSLDIQDKRNGESITNDNNVNNFNSLVPNGETIDKIQDTVVLPSKNESVVRSELPRPQTSFQEPEVANGARNIPKFEHIESVRPHTVAAGEVLEYLSEDGVFDQSCEVTYFKGKRIKNYVAPHKRYKKDPFSLQRREKLLSKLAKDDPTSVTEHRKSLVKVVNVGASKAARERQLQHLIQENSKDNKKRQGIVDTNFDGKIKQFLGSISGLCDETNRLKNTGNHPLLA